MRRVPGRAARHLRYRRGTQVDEAAGAYGGNRPWFASLGSTAMLVPLHRRRPGTSESVVRSRRAGLLTSLALTGTPAAVSGLALLTAAPVHADTARVTVAKRDGAVYPTRVVVTSAAGARRSLGPFRLRSRSSHLLASPDGRYLLVVPEPLSRHADLTVVSLESGMSVPLRAPRGTTIVPASPMLAWATDGNELVIDHAFVGDPESDPTRWSVLRCPAPTFTCHEVEDSDGDAAAIPRGFVSGSTLLSLFPSANALRLLTSLTQGDDWFTRGSASARELRRLVASPVTSQITANIDGQPRVLSTTRRNLRQGVSVTTAIVGGVSGALLSQEVYRATVRSQRNRVGGTMRVTQRRLVRVTADGATYSASAPRLTIPRAHAVPDPVTDRSRAERAPVVPEIGLPSGGWLATAGTQPTMAYALTLVRMDAGGAARFVRSRGRIVSATSLEAVVRGAASEPGRAGLTVVGYEQATDAAIVVVHWWESGRRGLAAATVRVPLDERTAPTVVSRTEEHASW